MKITKQEVKTIYSIQFDLADFTNIYLTASGDPARLEAFSDFDLSIDSMDYIKKCYSKLSNWGASNDIRYIVRRLGFDGVENFGGFRTRRGGEEVYCCSVYDNGNDFEN